MTKPIDAIQYESLAHAAVRALSPDHDIEAMSVVFNLIRAANRVQQDLETNVQRPAGLTFAAFRILFTVHAAGPLAPRQLAHLSSVSPASISSVLNTLERNGLVTRSPSDTDGRSILVALTDKGLEVVATLYARNNQREIAWTGALTAAEKRTFVRLVHKLLTHHPTPPPETGPRLIPTFGETRQGVAR
jgi:DNA-binding MarR family transcriptional regulator